MPDCRRGREDPNTLRGHETPESGRNQSERDERRLFSKTFEHVSPLKATTALILNWLVLAVAIRAEATILPFIVSGALYTTYAWTAVMLRTLRERRSR